MENVDTVGLAAKMLSNQFKRNLKPSDELTDMQGRIICYLYKNESEHVYQRDIESGFNIRRSTVTGILQLMEKNDLLVRRTVSSDARLKKLELTKKAIELHKKFKQRSEELEALATQGISKEEVAVFIKIANKMINNLEKNGKETNYDKTLNKMHSRV